MAAATALTCSIVGITPLCGSTATITTVGAPAELRAFLLELPLDRIHTLCAAPLEVRRGEHLTEVVLRLAFEDHEPPGTQLSVVGRARGRVEDRRQLVGRRARSAQSTRRPAQGDCREGVHPRSKAHRGSWVAARWGGVSGDPLRSPRCGGCDGGTTGDSKADGCNLQESDGDDTITRSDRGFSRDEAFRAARVARPSPTDRDPRSPTRRPRARSTEACGHSR